MKHLYPLLTLLVSFTYSIAIAQNTAPAIDWQKNYGGSGTEKANCIKQTKDGGYIVAGSTTSNNGEVNGNNGKSDCYIIKLGSSGTILWQKVLGGSEDDIAWSVAECDDGGYVVAGQTFSYDGDVVGNHGSFSCDCWIVKFSVTGNVQWKKCYGGGANDAATAILPTADGGYIFTGSSDSSNGDVTGHRGRVAYEDYWKTLKHLKKKTSMK